MAGEDVDVDPLRHDLVKDLCACPQMVLHVGGHRLDELDVAARAKCGCLLDMAQDRSIRALLLRHGRGT